MAGQGGFIVFRAHAVRRMFERGITVDDVRQVVREGEVIEEYDTDEPYRSRLMLGWVASGALHVVAADDGRGATFVITVYRPDPQAWEDGFRVRRR